MGIIGPGLVGSALLSQIVAQVGLHGCSCGTSQAACMAQRAHAGVAEHCQHKGWTAHVGELMCRPYMSAGSEHRQLHSDEQRTMLRS